MAISPEAAAATLTAAYTRTYGSVGLFVGTGSSAEPQASKSEGDSGFWQRLRRWFRSVPVRECDNACEEKEQTMRDLCTSLPGYVWDASCWKCDCTYFPNGAVMLDYPIDCCKKGDPGLPQTETVGG